MSGIQHLIRRCNTIGWQTVSEDTYCNFCFKEVFQS